MPLFRNSDSGGERSAAEREHARLEREARRRGLSVDDLLRERGELPPAEGEAEPAAPEPAPESEPFVEPEPVAEVPPAVEPEPEPEPVPEAEPEPEPEPEPEAEPEPEPVPEPEAEPEPEPVPEPEAEPEPEPVPEPEAEPEPEPVPEPVPMQAEEDITWSEPQAEPDIAWTEPEDEPEPTSVWEQPPAPGPTGDEATPVGDELPPKELEPPALPARAAARPLPRAPRRRYAQPDARRSPAQGPVRRRRSWFARIAAVFVLVAVVAVVWFLFTLFQPGKGDGNGTVVVTIPQGANARQIGDLLADKDVISSGFFFDLRTRLAGNRGEFKAGRFTLAHDMSYSAAMDALTQPTSQPQAPTVKVTIPEGRSRQEIAASLKQDGVSGSYLKASKQHKGFDPTDYKAPKDTPSLEGFLFPATYDLPKKHATASKLVGDQLNAFKDNFSSVSMRYAKKKNLTPYDVLIIASMVEREARTQKDRPLIAAVIYNRLKDGMPLGIDATTRYELNNWTDPLKQSELQRDSAYNTRTRRGLPPTPIGNPGLASIKAAAHPANVDYLYYVAKPGTCSHNFSSTDAQFQKDVQTYNKARDRNGGKSPTTC